MKFQASAEPNKFQALLDRFRAFTSGSGGTDTFGTTRITTGNADPEIARIKETRFSPAQQGVSTLDTAGYQNSINTIQDVYSQLLAQGQSAENYKDPYGGIKTDVRSRVDDLLKVDTSTGGRSSDDRTAAITGMIQKLVPEGSPRSNISDYQALIKTPSYESFVGGGTSVDRANAMAAANRAAMEARRPGNLAFFDELVKRMKG